MKTDSDASCKIDLGIWAEFVRKSELVEAMYRQTDRDHPATQNAAIASLAIANQFLEDIGAPSGITGRLNAIMLALDEASHGRKPDLLQRQDVQGSPSTNLDMVVEGAAAACVGVLVAAGMAVGAACEFVGSRLDHEQLGRARAGRGQQSRSVARWYRASRPRSEDPLRREAAAALSALGLPISSNSAAQAREFVSRRLRETEKDWPPSLDRARQIVKDEIKKVANLGRKDQ